MLVVVVGSVVGNSVPLASCASDKKSKRTGGALHQAMVNSAMLVTAGAVIWRSLTHTGAYGKEFSNERLDT